VAFDFTVTAEGALDWVHLLQEAGPCEITVAHANFPPAAFQRLGVSARHDKTARRNLPVVQQSLERDVRERVAEMLGSTDADVLVRPNRGDVADTILGMAADSRADLIITGTRQVQGISRAWDTSVSRSLLDYARESVVCVPVTAATRRIPQIPSLRRVLVATDLSPMSNRAVAHALAVAPEGGTVRLVHVVHPRAIAGGQFERGLQRTSLHTTHVQELGRQLQELLPPDEAGGSRMSIEAGVVENEDAAKGICQEAERFGADVIVLGSKRLSGIGKFTIGSVAQSVMARSTRPVFVTRLPER
jgi:nucleotide-binding universal stress UspA family protein